MVWFDCTGVGNMGGTVRAGPRITPWGWSWEIERKLELGWSHRDCSALPRGVGEGKGENTGFPGCTQVLANTLGVQDHPDDFPPLFLLQMTTAQSS